jgi:ketosteroid isomerase-like protein
MPPTDSAALVLSFVDAINRRDIAAMLRLVTDDHRFVDSLGEEIRGRVALRDAWIGYSVMVPDYRITPDQVIPAGDTVAVFGTASGTLTTDGNLDPANHWEMPAAWRAVITDSRIASWQVYADNEPVRALMERKTS